MLPLLGGTGPPADGTTGLFCWHLDDDDQGKELSLLAVALVLCGVLEVAEGWENGKEWLSEGYIGPDASVIFSQL